MGKDYLNSTTTYMTLSKLFILYLLYFSHTRRGDSDILTEHNKNIKCYKHYFFSSMSLVNYMPKVCLCCSAESSTFDGKSICRHEAPDVLLNVHVNKDTEKRLVVAWGNGQRVGKMTERVKVYKFPVINWVSHRHVMHSIM